MLGFKVLDNGDLKLTADNWARSELAQMNATERGYWSIMAEAFEPESCNGSYTHFDAGQGDPFVGFTNAPCIAEGIHIDEIGGSFVEGRLWYFDQYQTVCDFEELKNKGRVIYKLAY